MKWDVFISHAFEDKEFVRELATSLRRKGLKVWFDEFELKTGDGLTRTIDHGLTESRYGIVVLSTNFFSKEWTQKELGALTSRETKDEKVLLPIWYKITKEQIAKYSPMLADRIAIKSDVGIEKIVETLYSVIHATQIRTYLEVDLEIAKKLLRNKQIEMEAVLEQAEIVALTDPLTGLKNRRTILRELQSFTEKSYKDKSSLFIFMLDFDNFKSVNDENGHLIGDVVLSLAAQKINSFIKPPNIIGRVGGEEFLIIMPNSSQQDSVQLAELLCQQIQLTPINYENYQFSLTVSIGIASYKGKEKWDELFNHADKALYHAKSKGGNQWIIFE